MICALNTRDVSDHERRLIARLIGDGRFSQEFRVSHPPPNYALNWPDVPARPKVTEIRSTTIA